MAQSRLLFGIAVFLSSFLLFLIEPIAARQLVPIFGGSAAVWITCLVFFQTALLGGYLYAHWLTHASRPVWQRTGHLVLLLLASATAILWAVKRIPMGHASEHPVSMIFLALAASIGLPFLMLGATSPLLQVWLARMETSGVPYRLFALSNLASLLALGLYPTVIEPHFTLKTQRIAWCCGFAVFAALAAYLALNTKPAKAGAPNEQAKGEAAFLPTPLKRKLLWILLPMGASMQLSAVTSHLTANIAAIPLLWILPLAVYLVTLILAFQFPSILPRGLITRLLVVMLASLGYMLSKVDVSLPIQIGIIFFLIELFIACLFCHTEAYRLRPATASESTLFYLMFAAGGALGSFLVGIVFPTVFSSNYDLALSFLVTALLAFAVTWPSGWGQRLLWFTASVLLLVLVFFLHAAYQRDTLLATRNFYGSLRVRQTYAAPDYTLRTLSNGSIQHGTQMFSPERMKIPTTYYAEDSGVGVAMRLCCKGRSKNIGVVGLGAGTLAAYGLPGDSMRFYEINPSVRPIAEHLFTYIRNSQARISFAEGDARKSLEQEAPQRFDVLVIDAFSGDAIPLHLLTKEAMALYQRHLSGGGVLAFHVSNQHVNLEPEIALLAKEGQMTAVTVSSPPNEQLGAFKSTWVLVTNNQNLLDEPEVASKARVTKEDPKVRLWTDDYSSLLPILHW